MPVMNAVCNQYFIHIRKGQKPIPWNIYDSNPPVQFGLTDYFGKVFQAIEKSSAISGLVFYITWDEIDELPTYGDNVVVFVVGDEWYRIPKYFHKVRAVFKCLGTRPILGCNPIFQPSLLNLLTLIQFLRILIVCLPGLVRYQLHKLNSWFSGTGRVTPIYDIPLGYKNSKDLPIKPLETRLYDTYFSGSILHTTLPIWSLKRWLGTPKIIARKLMISSLKKLQAKNRNLHIELSITAGYHNRTNKEERSYCETMMDTKICVVPRGTSFETTRLFEGMKYGCVVVAEALPQRWYLDGAPIIQIKDWRDWEKVLERLLNNQQLMAEMHQKSLKWWQHKCSEAVVADYVVEKLDGSVKLRNKYRKLSPVSNLSISLTPP
ncbi:glycosyltransferase family 1 protein [Nostoc sp. TCL26-01]|uniref:glycosyltransferase family 1 protein n=1 Tax=Nostoc sp. TCL26-01 TaxID=2576904 RepID=UPI0015C0D967|nr:glycosyltransferase family 1 protein [Nostoc sp. TCL26-01]QLE56526.1 glycosyltransferase family 1 protein [Nostoc sp. TCL26-01]